MYGCRVAGLLARLGTVPGTEVPQLGWLGFPARRTARSAGPPRYATARPANSCVWQGCHGSHGTGTIMSEEPVQCHKSWAAMGRAQTGLGASQKRSGGLYESRHTPSQGFLALYFFRVVTIDDTPSLNTLRSPPFLGARARSLLAHTSQPEPCSRVTCYTAETTPFNRLLFSFGFLDF
ncbi:hypothetical protein GGR52DRAFT_434785 [Hypoxylon sp. FL1284]|nr:hypothetical protein GGR52DRAFT_434785 [Hypoxylon sp. FL1284]